MSNLHDILETRHVAVASVYDVSICLQVQRPSAQNCESLRLIHHQQHEQNLLLRCVAHVVPL